MPWDCPHQACTSHDKRSNRSTGRSARELHPTGGKELGGGRGCRGSGTRRERVKKKKYYGVFVCDLTFSIGLQMQAECAGASSGTVNKVMYSCGVWAACGDCRGRPVPPKGDQLSPSLWQSLLAPQTPGFHKASESQALSCALDGDK